MKPVFIIAIVAVAMIGIVAPSALAESLDPGFIRWSSSVMEQGDRLTIEGRTYGNGYNQDSASFRITNPIGNLAVIDQVSINRDGFFTASFLLDGSGFKKTGIYDVLIKSQQSEWSFEFELIKNKSSPLDYHKTTAPSPSPSSVHPLVIVGVLFALIAIALVILKISKRNSSKGEDNVEEPEEPEDHEEPEEEAHPINVKEFLTALGYGDGDEFIRKFKSGKTEQECQKAYLILLSDLKQQNADPPVITYVMMYLIQGSKQEPTIPKRPDAPRLSNASTATQPLKVIVNWTAPNDGGSKIISYDLYRSATGKSKGFHIVERGIRGLTFMDTLPSEGTWYYDIIATNSIGSSPPSLDASITVGSSGSGDHGDGDRGEGRGSGGEGRGGRKTSYTEQQIQDYKTLEISPGASKIEIKDAHRKLIIIYHPDKAKSDSQREEFTVISKNVNLARSRLLKKQHV